MLPRAARNLQVALFPGLQFSPTPGSDAPRSNRGAGLARLRKERTRFPLVVATVLALLLVACSGPEEATPSMPPQDTLVPTAEPTRASPTTAPPTPESPENTLVETPEYTGVIVSEEGAAEFSYLFDQASTTFWKPSGDEISSAEACIRRVLVSIEQDAALDPYQKEDAVFILENLETYRRQYVGIVVGGEKRVWINAFFSEDSFPNWQRVPVDVDDGGKHFWQIEYVVPTDECINFMVHGEA